MAPASLHAAHSLYEVINLGTTGGASSSFAYGINDAGQVVGSSGGRAALFSPSAGNEGNRDLGTLGGSSSYANAINNAGQIVGHATISGNTTYRATLFRTAEEGGNLNLGTLGGPFSRAYDINDAGQIVGWSEYAGNGILRATLFRTAEEGGNRDLGTLGGADSRAYGINDAGLAIGQALTSEGAQRAALFSLSEGNDGNLNLGTLGGGNSSAYGINNFGQTVGNAGGTGFLVQVNEAGGSIVNAMESLDELVDDDAASGATNIRFFSSAGNPINDWGQIAATGAVTGQGTRALLLNPTTPNTRLTGETRNTKFVDGMDYSRFTATTRDGGLGTTVDLLGGTTGSSGWVDYADGGYGRNRDVTVAFRDISFFDEASGIVSDVISLTGTQADVFVLSLSYNPAEIEDGAAAIYWLDSGAWTLAGEGNDGGNFEDGSFAGTFDDYLAHLDAIDPLAENETRDIASLLGAYGSAGGTAWAVLNHNSDFGVFADDGGVSAIPEPGSAATLALLLTSAIGLHRQRRKARR